MTGRCDPVDVTQILHTSRDEFGVTRNGLARVLVLVEKDCEYNTGEVERSSKGVMLVGVAAEWKSQFSAKQ